MKINDILPIPNLIRFLLIVLISCPEWSSGQSATSRDIDGIDVLHYNIHLTPDWEMKSVRGNVIISILLTKSLNEISLSESQLRIDSIYTDRHESLAFTTDTSENKLHVQLDRFYPVGSIVHLTIYYESTYVNNSDPNQPGGSFGKGIRFFEPTEFNPIRHKQCWTQSELFNTSYWLPCHTDIADLCTTDFTATVDKGLQFITNGEIVSHNENPDGTTTYHYATAKPYPIYLAAFVVGEYAVLTEVSNEVQLNTWCYPDEQEAAKATTVKFSGMLKFLEDKTGYAYPFDHYTQVMVQDYPFPSSTGQHTFSIISDNMIDDFGTHQDFQYLWDGVEFNALASQWFGNVITPTRPQDLWLTKSFAQYFEGKFTAAQHGLEEYLLWYQPWETGNVLGDWQNGNRHAIVPDQIGDHEQFAADSYCKYRGALVLHMLEKEIGEEAILLAIRDFVNHFAFQPVVTSDFQNAVERVSGQDLDWFFNQWIYGTGHPVFQIRDSYDVAAKSYQIEIQQIQEQDTTKKQPFYFAGHIACEIDGQKEMLYIEPKAKNTFHFQRETQPASMYMNSEERWICEMHHERNLDQALHVFAHSKDMAARQTALNELVYFAQQDTTDSQKKEAILQAFREVIRSDDYWRFRYNVIGQMRLIQKTPIDTGTISLLIELIAEEESWIRAAAITSLGMTCDSTYVDLYIQRFDDLSDRVRNAAAIALGKTKSSGAYVALIALSKKPSWKNQSLMHCLSGLAQLGDPRGEDMALKALADVASPRWFLGNGWDYPVVAVQTLLALGKTERSSELLLQRFHQAMKTNNSDDIFYQVLLIVSLQNAKGAEIFPSLKKKFEHDAQAMTAISMYEEQLNRTVSSK